MCAPEAINLQIFLSLRRFVLTNAQRIDLKMDSTSCYFQILFD